MARLALAGCCAYGLFANHWARDSLGALQTPLETDPPYQLDVRDYNTLTSVYFFPNICVPVFAGIIAQRYGASLTYLAFFVVAALGNALVGSSVFVYGGGAYGFMLGGRVLMGVAYEAVDMLPIGFMASSCLATEAPQFEASWSTMVGILNGVNRLGSVLNFILEPILYRAGLDGGLELALLVPSLVGASGVLTAFIARKIDVHIARKTADGTGEEPKDVLLPFSRESIMHIPFVFWLYIVGGACVYGAVVPFWFIGAKHLQVKFGMPLDAADALLLFPEGMIALVAPPFGANNAIEGSSVLIDRQKWSLTKRLVASCVSLAPISISLFCLAWVPFSPTFFTLILGTSYAFAQNLIWASITLVSPKPLLNICGGLTGTALNLLPSLVPFFFSGNTSMDVTILAAIGSFGVIIYLAAVRESLAAARRRTLPGQQLGECEQDENASKGRSESFTEMGTA